MRDCCDVSSLPMVRSTSSLASDQTWDAPDSTASAFKIKIPSTWTVGKVSLTFLLLAAAGDFLFQQFRGLNNFEAYDALSSDVIRPAFSYTAPGHKPKSSLGSAAIRSVTDALSPILPFTGGVDLRREEYRASSSWETLQSLYTRTVEAFSSQQPYVKSFSDSQPKWTSRVKAPRKLALSATEPFVASQVIAQLTLSDVAETFRYAVESNQVGFDEARFLRKLSPETKKVVLSMKSAVETSRGSDASDSMVLSTDTSPGNVDAVKFSAVMRIFAEWRLLRQTPEGYKGFEIGMSLGHKDIVQNVAKIEQKVHEWLDVQCELIEEDEALRSPTIAQILEYEKDMNVHPKLPRLTDRTAAMGLLWVRRQLEYQTRLFGNALMVPSKFPLTKDAVVDAYNQVYDRYHGWAVQKIFHYSFQSAPEAAEIYRHMNPRKLKEVEDSLRNGKLARSTVSTESSTEDAEGAIVENDNPVVAFFENIGNWWKDVTSDNAPSPLSGDGDEFDRFVSSEMVKDAMEHITLYMQVAEPLLNDLSRVFDLYNMDDPTRV